MLSVLEMAYLRKAQEHPRYSMLHQKILYILLHEKKYYEKGELLCLANNNLNTLEKALEELEETGIVRVEGWLVRLVEATMLHEALERRIGLATKNKKTLSLARK